MLKGKVKIIKWLICLVVMCGLVGTEISFGIERSLAKPAKVKKKQDKPGRIAKSSLLKIKKNPPYKIGDIIGYSEPNLPERYVGKVVVAAKWGDKLGKIPLIQKRYGPIAIQVDKEDNVYILSHQVSRVQKYNNNGKWIKSINYHFFANRFYVNPRTQEIYPYDSISVNQGKIGHYAKDGKLIATYQAPKDIELDCGIYVENGILYSKWDGRKICKVKRPKMSGPLKYKRKEYEERIKAYDSMVSWVRERKGEDIVKKMKINTGLLRKSKFLKAPPLDRKDGVIIEPPLHSIFGELKEIDEEGNLYILWEIQSEKDRLRGELGIGNPEYEIRKYTLTGKLLAVVKMRKSDWTDTLGIKPNLIVIIGGKIYELWTDKDRCYVFKWIKKGG